MSEDPTADNPDPIASLDDEARTRLEAAVFRRMLAHFQERTDVQNIDVMNTAGFCRNCLTKWLHGAATDAGLDLEFEGVREHVYGMSYATWKSDFQK
jgi:hypothetical protein